MLELDYTEDVRDFLDSLTPKEVFQVFKKLDMLRENPRSGNTIQLVGHDLCRTRAGIDRGEIRIIHRVENDDTLFVLLIGLRGDDEIYKELRRLYP